MKKKSVLSFGISSLMILLILAFKTTYPVVKESLKNLQQNRYEDALNKFGLANRMEHHGVSGVSFGVIKNGKLDWAKGYGVLQNGESEKVNTQTLFSVGSISKVGTAVMILKMQEEGILDIDQDVNNYLTSWKVPDNNFTQEQPVTLRRILSHTAGLTVHGFADFYPGEEQPSTVQILNGEPPAKNDAVYVNIPVGSKWRYSGGGTTVSQMVIEDQTGKPFYTAADEILFEALDMERSSYQNPLPLNTDNIAKAHNSNGEPVALPRGYQSMPEAAASGLWTNPTDFSKIMIMLMEAYQDQNSYLSQPTVQDMMTAVPPGDYGLGPRIKDVENDIQFSHGGANDSYRARFVGYTESQNGFIIFTNGRAGNNLINELATVFEELL